MLLLHYAVLPRLVWEWKPGSWFLWTRGMAAPWDCRRVGDWRPRWDLHPHSSRRQRVAFLFSYESEMVGSAGNAPVRHFRFCLTTPDLQSGNRNTSPFEFRVQSEEFRMFGFYETSQPSTYEQNNLRSKSSNSSKACRRMKPRGFLRDNFSAPARLSVRITVQFAALNQRQISSLSFKLCWKKPTNPGSGSNFSWMRENPPAK
jgi:hypothetical protein